MSARVYLFVLFYRVVSMFMYIDSWMVAKVHISRRQWLLHIVLFILISFSDNVFLCITLVCHVILLSNAKYSSYFFICFFFFVGGYVKRKKGVENIMFIKPKDGKKSKR